MTIRMFLWAILGFAVAGLAFWMIMSTTTALPQPFSLLILASIWRFSRRHLLDAVCCDPARETPIAIRVARFYPVLLGGILL